MPAVGDRGDGFDEDPGDPERGQFGPGPTGWVGPAAMRLARAFWTSGSGRTSRPTASAAPTPHPRFFRDPNLRYITA
jgi:hypothetical protein